MPLPSIIANNQGTGLQNFYDTGENEYIENDYGAAWATTATITADLAKLQDNPANGDVGVLWNTNGATGRLYVYAAVAWRYVTLT